jgi:hypothetical protein
LLVGSERAVWYSDDPADQRGPELVVLNVNALTLAAIARLDRFPRERLAIEFLLRRTAKDGHWPYRLGSAQNDLEHHCFMVEGTHWAAMPEAESAFDRLASFFRSDGSFDRKDPEVMGSHHWEPGDALAELSLSPRWGRLATRLAANLAPSIGRDGVSSFADRDDPRSIVRYGFGLARFAVRGRRSAGANSSGAVAAV